MTSSHAGECAPPLNQRKGGHILLQLRGRQGPNSDDWRKGPALFQLSTMYKRNIKSAKWILLYSTQCTQKPLRVTLRNHTSHKQNRINSINSVKSLYSVRPTPYHECTQLVQKILLLNWIKVTLRSQQTAYIHSTELVWPRTFMERSCCNRLKWLWLCGVLKISIKWLWPVKVTLKVIKRRLRVFCWSCEEGPLK